MANRLTMAQIDAILTLRKTRKSNREIAKLLEVDRGTVGKYVRKAVAQNRPNAPTGSCCSLTRVTRLSAHKPHAPKPPLPPANQDELFTRTTPLPRIGIEEITSRRNPLTCRF